MKGTEKQIRWAQDIKAEFNEEMDREVANLQKMFNKQTPEIQAKARPMFDARLEAISKINEQEDAKFWIDHRTRFGPSFVKDVAEGKLVL